MASHAKLVDDAIEARRILRMLIGKYPEQSSVSLPETNMDELSVFRVTPKIISVLDYSKGFGHTDLVTW
jgi:hypothetical protein